jgi:hypothetical protein
MLAEEGYDVDESEIIEGRKSAGLFSNLLGPQNIMTAENSAVHYSYSPYSYVLDNPISYIDALGLDTGKVIQIKEVKITGYKPSSTWWLGPGLITLGQPIIPKSSPIVRSLMGHAFEAGRNRSTSIASLASRAAVKKVEKLAGNKIAKVVGEKVAKRFFMHAGGVLGRFVPWVGWALTAKDVYDLQTWGVNYTVEHAGSDANKEDMLNAYSLAL